MHTIQLFGGAAARARFLRRARTSLRRGGLLACAVLAHVEQFAFDSGEPGPEPETAMVGGTLYISRPTRVTEHRHTVVIERERSLVAISAHGAEAQGSPPPVARRTIERSMVELQRLPARVLEREARAAGLRVERAREITATEDHGGSTVVMLRA